MKTINSGALYAMPFQPIKRAINRAIVKWQLNSMDSHIISLERSIKNDMRAKAELEKDRAFLSRRLL